MSAHTQNVSDRLHCQTYEAIENEPACVTCEPKLALSLEEEEILGSMREIKAQVRELSAGIQRLGVDVGQELPAGASDEERSEWATLTDALSDLQAKWREWQDKLEEATDRKLVALGHR
jgi:hypothetical protein